jgi:hypothetical protein
MNGAVQTLAPNAGVHTAPLLSPWDDVSMVYHNDYTISVLNYHIALVDYSERELEDLDRTARTVLRTYKALSQGRKMEED